MTKLMIVCVVLLFVAIFTFLTTSPTPRTGQIRKQLETIIRETPTPVKIDNTITLRSIELKPNLTLLYTYETTQTDTAFATRLPALTRTAKAQACAANSLVVTRGATYQYQWLTSGRSLLYLAFKARDCATP